MNAEMIQLALAAAIFLIVAGLWLYVIYLPGRTLERWEGDGGPRGRRDAEE